jgi:hypothetical protein
MLMSNPKKISDIFKETKIWKHFESIASTEKIALIEDIADYAIGILDKIIETFPTYTMHNGQHQLNILNIYEKILGEKLKDLTNLEAAILILGAFYHDIGMVFKKEEKENLASERDFKDFLSENNKAKLDMAENRGIISDSTAEWYCRWSHAKRVWIFLNKIDEKLIWERNNFRKELAYVCLSHNEKAEFIKEETLSSNYWNNADLKFCALILRLADLLDFDNTRTPSSLYQFLDLENPKNKNEEKSKLEWQKHFASRGFVFDNWNESNNYEIGFQASPKSPSIEKEIRLFLNYIENELLECNSILQFCSDRWRNFKFPDKINRQNIISQGYTYGDFKFSLDQQQILSLLMGENLYDNKFVCIRELLQNAIDTSRHREFYERNNGNVSYKAKPIEVSTWHDKEGYRWIRVDDYGMGMTYSQISKYFLKVGNSYYNSDEFKIEKIKYKNANDFAPISQFGIGILSCFIVANVVEVNTHSMFADEKINHPIRLSLKGMSNYFVLQTKDDIASAMPKSDGEEKDYRKEKGTSIAIRLNPNNDLHNFNLSRIMNEILFNPPIDIVLLNEGKKGIYLKDLDINSTKKESHKITGNDLKKIKEYIKGTEIKDIAPEIEKILISLNNTYSHPDIKGFLYLFRLNLNVEFRNNHSNHFNQVSIRYSSYNKLLTLSIFNKKYFKHEFEVDISHLLNGIELFDKKDTFYDIIVLSHNGIIIPNKRKTSENKNGIGFCSWEKPIQILGYIELSGSLRPNLNIARNSINSIPWILWSNLNYTIRKNLPKEYLTDFKMDAVKVKFDYRDLNEDLFLIKEEYWPAEKIFSEGQYSLIDILDEKCKYDGIFIRNDSIKDIMQRKLVELYSKYEISLFKKIKGDKFVLISKSIFRKNVDSTLNKSNYPPLTFCSYNNFNGLMPEKLNNQIFNIKHPFSKWLIKAYDYLESNYSNHLYLLMNSKEISIVNETLKKLRDYLPETYKPAVDLSLAEEDFKVDFDSIPLLE